MKRFLMIFVMVMVMAQGGISFAQVPANPPVQKKKIEMKPLVKFDKLIDQIKSWFIGILRQYWAWFLSIFFAWFAAACLKSFLDGKMEKRMVRIKQHERFINQVNNSAEKTEVERVARQQEMERTHEVERFEREHLAREVQRDSLHLIVLRENESFVDIAGDRYIRKWSSEGDIIGHESYGTWLKRRECEQELEKPLDFDNNDYGRIYDSIVDKDKEVNFNRGGSYVGRRVGRSRSSEV
jgi:hypothetical protein